MKENSIAWNKKCKDKIIIIVDRDDIITWGEIDETFF